jgi:hypothetical protein
VASKSTDVSIRLYNGRNHYNEWQFLATQATLRPGGTPGAPQPGMPGGRGGPGGRGPGGMGPGGPGRQGGFQPGRPPG